MKTDSELQRDVLEEVRWEPRVDAAHIGVSVKDGIATLTGHVTSYPEKYAAEEAAKRVYGVRAVANELDVKLPDSRRRTDEDIAVAAVNALKSNSEVPADRVQVTVSNGWLKLEGEVEWQFQKSAAERAVRYLPGVTGVSNLIKIKPTVAPTDLQAKIENAFRRNAVMEARRIKVQVQGSKVILRGHVLSAAERKEAERAAWSAPGASQVDNQIVVTERKPRWVLVTSVVGVLLVLFLTLAWPGLLFRNWLGPTPANPPPPPQGRSEAVYIEPLETHGDKTAP